MGPSEQSYRTHAVDAELDELALDLPAISLDGPKGVGKTETALQRAGRIFRLDRARDVELLRARPELLLTVPVPVLIDEWQQWPPVWDEVRRAVDDGAEPGSIFLTGSATPVSRIHSGAGRITSLRMRPMTLAERGVVAPPSVSLAHLLHGGTEVEGETDFALPDYLDEICDSGLPGIRKSRSARGRRAQLDGYLDRLLDHEVVDNGALVRRPGSLRRWLTAYAAASATTTTYEKIRDAATPGESTKPAKPTAIGYRDVLERLWVLDPLPGWSPSRRPLGRLTQAPKHHLADPALAARLLGTTPASLLERDRELIGPLFESLATLTVRVFAQAAEARVVHLRTQAGRHEVDLVVTGGSGRVLAIEVKLAAAPDDRDVQHLHWLREQIGDDLIDAIVITAGPYAYRRPDGVAVVPLALLGA